MIKRLIIVCIFITIFGATEELKAQPDLYISNITLSPSEPIQNRPVEVKVAIKNRGRAPTGPFTVEWWAGENYPTPACRWNVKSLRARGARLLTCRYSGYPSAYERLLTKAVVDPRGEVAESNENNNEFIKVIRVRRGIRITDRPDAQFEFERHQPEGYTTPRGVDLSGSIRDIRVTRRGSNDYIKFTVHGEILDGPVRELNNVEVRWWVK